MKTSTTALAITALLTGCATGDAQAAPCDDATETAHAAHDAATSAFDEMKTVRAEPVDPNLSTELPEDHEDTERFDLPPSVEAKMAADAEAAQQRGNLHAEAQRQTRKWATVIEQNPDCFDAGARANAAETLRKFADS